MLLTPKLTLKKAGWALALVIVSGGTCALALWVPHLSAQTMKLGTIPPAAASQKTVSVPNLPFKDENGREVSVADFKGRYLLLNLWATWCGPCGEEMPSLDALSQYFPAGRLTIAALTEDHDGADAARAYYTRHNIRTLALYVDSSGQAPALLHAQGLPTTLLIGPDGKEIKRFEGAVNWTSPEMLAYLAATIK